MFSCFRRCSRVAENNKSKSRDIFLYTTIFSPLDCSKRFTLSSPGRPVHSDINPASLGSILVTEQLNATTNSLIFPPPSIARYSFIQLSELEHHGERKFSNFETVAKGAFEPGLSQLQVRHSTTELLCSTN